MKFHVNESCIGCGLCSGTCPSVFTMTDEGVARAIEGDAPAKDVKAAREAKDNCPVGAIEEV
ncbi:MAG: ferredoxin [Pyramidobacter sp.]|jgi:ferredoxin